MARSDILEFNLIDLSKLIGSRELSSSEAVTATLARLELLEDKLNAFITVLPEQALAEAKKADEEIARGHDRGPLHGVPVTIKDMFEMAGVLTTGGSKILADWVPETNSALVERLRAAGAIIVGKTNLDEFGHGGTSTLSHFGPVHNPWDVERIAGGSSGGSAAAVAAGKAAVKEVVFRKVTEDAARLAALESGQADFINAVPVHEVARLQRHPRIRVDRIEGLEMYF
jgi:Asp-tRNA(Asn)/Glu-tRNA(Gln) amidotransferase A subunit family amidase